MNYQQFYTVLDDWKHRRYDWDQANCCHFAADIARCSGVDIDVPGFDTAKDAATWIREQGVRSLYHYLVKLFGKPVAPLQAKRGFIAYRKGEGIEGSAIGTVDRKAVFIGDTGLIELPLSTCAGAFDPGKYRGGAS